MRILHLFANYKWTGPADPAIRCAVHLRRLGADVVFAQAGWTLPGAEHRMAKELRRNNMPVVAGLELRKHFHVPSLMRDARRLRRRLDVGEFDVVHAHLLADHLIAAVAKRRAAHRPVLVRSYYEPDSPPGHSWRERVALRYTDGVIAPTVDCREQLQRRFSIGDDSIYVQDAPIDGGRRELEGDLRLALGLSRDDFVVGITARIQPHRRFNLLWEAVALAVRKRPRLRLVLLGRGNPEDTLRFVAEPVRELGLQDHVVRAGYLYEPEYSLALRSLDAFAFLVPGSDGTCRAVREAMALGLPVVATRRGILPELLGPAEPGGEPCGLNVDETPDDLAAALIRMHDDVALRRRLGAAALARATGPMEPRAAARRLLAFYQSLQARARGAS